MEADKLYEYIDKEDLSRLKWAKEILLTRYSLSYSISLMIMPVTEWQFNILFFMKRLCFATDWRCLADTGNIFQNNVAL